jgi:hypothetical protein
LFSTSSYALADVRITEFMSEGQGDTDSGNGGRRQREFFELTNLGNAVANVATWSYNDNNVNDPFNWGASIGSIAAQESIVFTQMTEADFRNLWQLPAGVRILSYGGASNLGNADTINIYNSTTQDATTLVDTLTYTADARGSGLSRNRLGDGGQLQYVNSSWVDSISGDPYQSRFAPTPVSFAAPYDNPANYRDLANPGVYTNVPEPAGVISVILALAAITLGRNRNR